MIDHKNTYWNDAGRFNVASDALHALIPEEGDCPKDSPALERLRLAANIYYDLFNNGLCNMADEFREVFGFQPKVDDIENEAYLEGYHRDELERWYRKVEMKMDIFVQRAAEEQGVPLPETAQ